MRLEALSCASLTLQILAVRSNYSHGIRRAIEKASDGEIVTSITAVDIALLSLESEGLIKRGEIWKPPKTIKRSAQEWIITDSGRALADKYRMAIENFIKGVPQL